MPRLKSETRPHLLSDVVCSAVGEMESPRAQRLLVINDNFHIPRVGGRDRLAPFIKRRRERVYTEHNTCAHAVYPAALYPAAAATECSASERRAERVSERMNYLAVVLCARRDSVSRISGPNRRCFVKAPASDQSDGHYCKCN
jgi:hypothetical protein